MSFRTIHTLDARNNVMLEVLESAFNLKGAAMRRFIWKTAEGLAASLAAKGIAYQDLESALVPQVDRREIALFFDITAIDRSWYGFDVQSQILPLLDPSSRHSTRHGDLLTHPPKPEWVSQALEIHLQPRPGLERSMPIPHGIYCVYINNVSPNLQGRLVTELARYKPYLGHADMTFGSRFKTYLSRILTIGYLKHGGVILQSHPDDEPDDRDQNTSGYPFEKQGWTCRSVADSPFGLFLSYKIESPIFAGDDADSRMAANVFADLPKDPSSFEIEIEDAKLTYLLENKGGSFKRLGIKELSVPILEGMIQEKLTSNCVYNMSYSEDHEVAKFNMIFELDPADGRDPVRMLGAFEYKIDNERLRLITMF